jgi:hypothetical protein
VIAEPSWPTVGDWYVHWKTGDEYQVKGFSRSAEDKTNVVVLYLAAPQEIPWNREVDDFISFVPIERFRKEGATWHDAFKGLPADAKEVKRFTHVPTPIKRIPWGPHYSWACVSADKPKDSSEMLVVRVTEDPGHTGAVTREHDGKVFTTVYGGVHSHRSGARQAKEVARKQLGVRKYTAKEHHGADDDHGSWL